MTLEDNLQLYENFIFIAMHLCIFYIHSMSICQICKQPSENLYNSSGVVACYSCMGREIIHGAWVVLILVAIAGVMGAVAWYKWM